MSRIPKKFNSKYQVNHNIFQEETERSFYLAGFIAADGCIRIAKTNKNRNYINHRLQISLSRNDKKHLILIRKLLESDNPIRDYLIKNSKRNSKWNDVWESKLMITSKQIVEDLRKFNIVPRKSLTYAFPKWLEKHPLKHHFMRGYFDGDGSFFIDSFSKQLCCSLRGTEKFLKTYKKILKHKGGNMDKHNRTPQLRFKGKLSIKTRDFLYNNATFFLPRKHKVAYKFKE